MAEGGSSQSVACKTRQLHVPQLLGRDKMTTYLDYVHVPQLLNFSVYLMWDEMTTSTFQSIACETRQLHLHVSQLFGLLHVRRDKYLNSLVYCMWDETSISTLWSIACETRWLLQLSGLSCGWDETDYLNSSVYLVRDETDYFNSSVYLVQDETDYLNSLVYRMQDEMTTSTLRSISYKTRRTISTLQSILCEMRPTISTLWSILCEMRPTISTLRSISCKTRPTISTLWSIVCEARWLFQLFGLLHARRDGLPQLPNSWVYCIWDKDERWLPQLTPWLPGENEGLLRVWWGRHPRQLCRTVLYIVVMSDLGRQ